MNNESFFKQNRLWLWVILGALVLLLIAGAIVALVLSGNGTPGNNSSKPTAPIGTADAKLYWNMDRAQMQDTESGQSNRKPDASGKYTIRLSLRGQTVEVYTKEKKTVNRIDSMELVCLRLDDRGFVEEAFAYDAQYVQLAKQFYVQKVEGNTLKLNSAIGFNGMELEVTLSDAVGVYDVTEKATVVGAPTTLGVMDQVSVFGTDEETPTDIYLHSRPFTSKVYWRTAQYFNSTTKQSTRPKNADGYWYVTFTVEGEQVTLRTNDQSVINAIDGYSVNAACCGLVFNESGDIIDCFSAAIAVRGTVIADAYDVQEVGADSFTCKRVLFSADVGKVFTGKLSADTKIYNVSSTAKVFGEETTLQVGDRIYVLADAEGNPSVIYVINRLVDSPMYYNISRNYSSSLGKTQRKPDANGWYNIQLAVKGEIKTFRTKDYELVNKLDAYDLCVFGMKVDGNLIVQLYDPVCVAGNYAFAANYFVTDYNGSILTCESTTAVVATGSLAADCEIYDVSGNGAFKGVKTEVRKGDRVICYTDPTGAISHIYITGRYEEGTELYWSTSRQYANGSTTRKPDANGFYVFDVVHITAAGPVRTQVKTDDKAMASLMDLQNPQYLALKVENGIVTACYSGEAVIGGYKNLNNATAQSKDVEGIWSMLVASTGAKGALMPADNMKVYNVSDGYEKMYGEETELKVGDTIYAIANNKGETAIVFVFDRDVDAKIYFNRVQQYDTATGQTTRTPDKDGYYIFELAVDGQVKTFKTNDKNLANKIDAQNLAFSLKVNGDIIELVYDVTATALIQASAPGSDYDVTSINGKTVSLTRNRPGQTDTGKQTSFKMAADCKVYDISGSAGANWGKAATLGIGDRIHAYTNNDGEVVIIYITYKHTRAAGAMAYCNHCRKTVWWEPFSSGKYRENVHYYLTHDYNATDSFGFFYNDEKATEHLDYVLDLNGHAFNVKQSYAIQVHNGNSLTIIDSAGGGVVSAGILKADGGTTGGVVMVSGNSTLNLKGGTYTHSAAHLQSVWRGGIFYVADAGSVLNIYDSVQITGGNLCGTDKHNALAGGGIYVSDGTVNMYGGKLYGNGGLCKDHTAAGATVTGGNLYVAGGTFNMYGGEIYDGLGQVGGNVYVANKAAFNVEGGRIAGDVYGASGSVIKLSGTPRILMGKTTGLKLASGVKIQVGALTGSVKVMVEADGVFTEPFAASDLEAKKLIDNKNFESAIAENKLYVDNKALGIKVDTSAKAWTDATKLPTEGNWKLTCDVTVTTLTTVKDSLYLDLNGFTVTRNVPKGLKADQFVFSVPSGMKLTIDDLSGKTTPGTVKAVYTDTCISVAGVICGGTGSEVTINNGIIDGTGIESTYANDNSGTITVGGMLTVNGGIIRGQRNTAGTNGASGSAIGGWGSSTIIINGGTIEAAKSSGATDYVCITGGCVSSKGHVTVNGGTLVGTLAMNHGGCIYVDGDGTLTVTGGTITGGSAGVGGNICMRGKTMTIGGEAKVDGGIAIRPGSSSAGVVKLILSGKPALDPEIGSGSSYSLELEHVEVQVAGSAETMHIREKTLCKLTYTATGEVSGVTAN